MASFSKYLEAMLTEIKGLMHTKKTFQSEEQSE